jgi:hypothetical protein
LISAIGPIQVTPTVIVFRGMSPPKRLARDDRPQHRISTVKNLVNPVNSVYLGRNVEFRLLTK